MSLLGLAACRDNDNSATGATGSTTTTTNAATVAAGPALTGSADEQCLVAGSPWKVSKPDLESQLRQVMQRINVTSVHIDGDQTLTVTPNLQAKIVDQTTTTIKAAMGAGLIMIVTQRHSGQTIGQWKISGNDLTPQGPWDGEIHIDSQVTINGRTGSSPIDVPSLGSIPLTFTCAGGSLKLSTTKSPFVWLFRS